MPPQNLEIRVARSMAEIDLRQWNACANPPACASAGAVGALASATPVDILDIPANFQEERFNPFITHEFLHCLESSGSATAKTGWAPMHVLVEQAGEIVAAAPAYLKSHSLGEYVFDH